MKTLAILSRQLIISLSVLATLTISVITVNADSPGVFTTLDYPSAVSTFAYGINAAGDIVGSYVDNASVEHGFLLRAGAFTSIDYPGAVWTQGWGISPCGDIIGQYGLSDKTIHGFLLRNGVFTNIDVPGQPNTMPVKINAAGNGTIVGCYHVNLSSGSTNLNTMWGFERTADGVITSHPLVRTMNNGVNPQGDIVGEYFDPATGRVIWSYLISHGAITWFQFSATDLATQAWDVGPAGEVVGTRRDAAGAFHGFLMVQGVMTSFDFEGATQTRGFGINASRNIVGYYVKAGATHGYVLVPTPISTPTPTQMPTTEPVLVWANSAGVFPAGNSLTKAAPESWTNAGASSTRAIAFGDGYIEFTATETNKDRMFGLNNVDSSLDYHELKFAIDAAPNGIAWVFESGTSKGVYTTYQAGDRFRIAIEAGVVKYLKNGTAFYISSVAPTYPLIVDTTLNTNGSTITDAKISGFLMTR